MKDIAKILLEIKAVALDTSKGFTYASGRKGPIYCDNRLLLSYPSQREKIVDAFLKLVKEKKLEFDIIAGVATGAIAWATFLAEKLKKPLIYVRSSAKGHGKGNQIEGKLEEGSKVLVVEDLVNTGGSSVDACSAVQLETDVVACVSIVSYGFDEAAKKFVSAKIPLYSLTNFDEIVSVASEMKYINAEEKKELFEWHRGEGKWK